MIDLQRHNAVFALVLSIFVVCVSPTIAASGFTLTVSDSVDTPTHTVEFESQTYEISAIGRENPGEVLRVHAFLPKQGFYRVLLYNTDRQIVASHRSQQNQTFRFDLTGYAPGSYMLSLHYDGIHQTVHPVVIQAYRVEIEAPETIPANQSAAVAVHIFRIAGNRSPHAVKVTLASTNRTVQTTARRVSASDYKAQFSRQQLKPGRYRIYATVHGSNHVFGRLELLGVSNSTFLSISNNSQSSPGSTKTISPTTTAPSTDHFSSTSTIGTLSGTPTTSHIITPHPTTPSKALSPGQRGFTFLIGLFTIGLFVVILLRALQRHQ